MKNIQGVNMKKIYFAILLLAIVFIAGCKSGATGKAVKDTGAAIEDTADKEAAKDVMPEKASIRTNAIEITSAGFNPKELTIKQGDTVTWINKDANGHWPASAKHPTHEVYPGSGIGKCGTAEQSKILDACQDIKQDGSWIFIFNEKGTWAYHDHSNPTLFGKIIVE